MKGKYHILLPLLTLAAGAAGFALRRWQLATALNMETQLFDLRAPASIVLILLAAAFAALIPALCRGGGKLAGYEAAFRFPGSTATVMVVVLAAFLMIGMGAVCAREGYTQYLIWANDYHVPKRHQFPMVILLLTALFPVAGTSIFMLGKDGYRGTYSNLMGTLSTLPVFCALAWLLYVYQRHGVDPVIMHYIWGLLAAVCTVLALYFGCCFAFDRIKPRRTLTLSLMGVFFHCITLADFESVEIRCAAVIFSIVLMAQAVVLIRNWLGPAWPKRLLEQGGRMPLAGGMEEKDVQPDAMQDPMEQSGG